MTRPKYFKPRPYIIQLKSKVGLPFENVLKKETTENKKEESAKTATHKMMDDPKEGREVCTKDPFDKSTDGRLIFPGHSRSETNKYEFHLLSTKFAPAQHVTIIAL